MFDDLRQGDAMRAGLPVTVCNISVCAAYHVAAGGANDAGRPLHPADDSPWAALPIAGSDAHSPMQCPDFEEM